MPRVGTLPPVFAAAAAAAHPVGVRRARRTVRWTVLSAGRAEPRDRRRACRPARLRRKYLSQEEGGEACAGNGPVDRFSAPNGHSRGEAGPYRSFAQSRLDGRPGAVAERRPLEDLPVRRGWEAPRDRLPGAFARFCPFGAGNAPPRCFAGALPPGLCPFAAGRLHRSLPHDAAFPGLRPFGAGNGPPDRFPGAPCPGLRPFGAGNGPPDRFPGAPNPLRDSRESGVNGP